MSSTPATPSDGRWASQVDLFVRLPHGWCIAGTEAIEEIAQAAEELGFAGVSVQDHLISDADVAPCGASHAGDDRSVFEALGVLTYVAGRTTRIRLLTGVLVLPYRHPVLLAKELATLDTLSRGRLTVGVGVGALVGRGLDAGQLLTAHASVAAREFQVMGVTGDRGKAVDESISVMNALWSQDPASFAGEQVAFSDLAFHPKPVQRPRPPIWIGGRSEAALRRTATLGDGWFPSQASPEMIAGGRRRIVELAEAHGRPVPRDQAVNLFASVAGSDTEARSAIAEGLGRRFEDTEALWSATIAGTPAGVIARIGAYQAAGVNALDLKLLPLTVPDTIDQMRLFAAEVMPALRQGRPIR